MLIAGMAPLDFLILMIPSSLGYGGIPEYYPGFTKRREPVRQI
jgi:hypothetical protein